MSTAVVPVAFSSRRLELVMNRHRWRRDPDAWAKERGRLRLWSKQREIMTSVRDNRKTAVKSCHGPGKTFTAAQVVAWWLDSHPPGEAGVVTTAPSDGQVKTLLWKEIRRTHARATLMGRCNQKEWLLTRPGGEELIVAFGKKPADKDPAGFQGTHFSALLVVLDEACGIPGETVDSPNSLWVAADSLLSNDDCRMLAIGNPDDPSSEFAKVCRPGSGWNTIGISAFDTPNFTGGEGLPEWILKNLVGHTWVEEKRREWVPAWQWNEDKTEVVPPEGVKIEDAHPLWLSKVLGRFPDAKAAMGLISPAWIEDAQRRRLEPGTPNRLGVDVGAGGDASTTCHRRGSVFRIISEDRNPDTMQTCGKVVAERRETRATSVHVDKIGIGQGIVDRGLEIGEPFVGINVGEAPACNCDFELKRHGEHCNTQRFVNWRAQLWWELRERFERGDADLDEHDSATATDLLSVRYKRTSQGKILIESKDEIRRRLGRSPDRGEAVMLANAEPKDDGPLTGGVL